MSIPPSDALWNALNGLAQLMLGEESVSTTLQRVVTSAVTLIEAVEECGATVVHDDRPTTDAATGGVVYEVDNFQYDVDQGPCLTALLSGEVIEIPCMRAEHRWPTYAAFAADRGICSSMSIPLTVAGGGMVPQPVVTAPSIAAAIKDGRVGVLNLYSRREGEFADEERSGALTFAAQAAIAIYNARTYEAARRLTTDLQAAMSSRAVIEQAKGILMGEHRIAADEAFALLQERSQRANRKLRAIAGELVAETAGESGDAAVG